MRPHLLGLVPEKTGNVASELMSRATDPSEVLSNWVRAQVKQGTVFIYFNRNQGGSASSYIFHPKSEVELFKWPHAELTERHISRPYALKGKFKNSIMKAIAPSFICNGMTMTLDESGHQVIVARISKEKNGKQQIVRLTRISEDGMVKMEWEGNPSLGKNFTIGKGGAVASTTPYARLDCVNLNKTLFEEMKASGFDVRVMSGPRAGEDVTTTRSGYDADGYFRYLGGKTKKTIGSMLNMFKENKCGLFVGHQTGHLGLIYWKSETELFSFKADLSDLRKKTPEGALRAITINLPQGMSTGKIWAGEGGKTSILVGMPDGSSEDCELRFHLPAGPNYTRTLDIVRKDGSMLLSLETKIAENGGYIAVGRALYFLNATTGVPQDYSVGGLSHLYDEPLHKSWRWKSMHAVQVSIVPQDGTSSFSIWRGPSGTELTPAEKAKIPRIQEQKPKELMLQMK